MSRQTVLTRLAVLAALSLPLWAAAQTTAALNVAPQPMSPDGFKWFSPPNNPQLKGAWVVGAEKDAGVYALRVALAQGGRIPAHTHPDTRFSTVLSGTLYVTFGNGDEGATWVPVPAGAVYVAPAGVPHALWARDGDVVYQESGAGPTATVPARP